MSNSWPYMKLCEVSTRIGGGTPSRDNPAFWNGELPWFTVADLADVDAIQRLTRSRECISQLGLESSAAKLVPNGAVVFSTRVVVGKVGITANPIATNQDFCSFVLSDALDADFLAYFLIKSKAGLRRGQRGATIKGVTTNVVDSLDVPVPPRAEQLRIVARIKECMERVDEMEKLRTESLMDAMSLDQAIFADFIESLSESDLETVQLGEILTECRYGSSKKASSDRRGIPIIRMGNIQNGKLDVEDLKFVDLPAAELRKYLLVEGDILINRTNSLELVGKSGLFQGLSGDWVFASYLVRLRVDRSKILPEFLNAVINSRIGRSYVLRTARRAIGMVNINAEEIKRMPIPLPPKAVQEKLVERMASAEASIAEVQASVKANDMPHLRDAILRKAFAGDL